MKKEKQARVLIPWILSLSIAAICAIVVFALLIKGEQDYLYTLHLNTFYADSEPFRDSILSESAGALKLFGAYVTQYFINPIFPTLLIPVLCFTQIILSDLIFNVRERRYGEYLLIVLALPSLLAFLSGQNYDYAIYDKFNGSSYVILFIGQILSLLLYSFTLIKWKYSYAVTLVMCLVLYPHIGIFAIVPVLMIGAKSIIERNKMESISSSISLIIIVLEIYLLAKHSFYEYFSVSFFSPLVDFLYGKTFYYALASLIIIACFPLLEKQEKREEKGFRADFKGLAIPIAAYCLFCIVPANSLKYSDLNYYTELKAKRLIFENEWKELLRLTNKVKTPTTSILAFREIGLLATDQAISRTFDMEVSHKDYNTSHFTAPHFIHYSLLAYYLGMPNVALFYAMETKQLSGMNFEILRYFNEIAVFSGEHETAEKYQDILAASPVYREYAEKWRRYDKDSELMHKELPHLQYIERMIDTSPATYSAQNVPQIIQSRTYLENTLTLISRLYSDLYMRDLDMFANDMVAMSGHFANKKIPAPVQEACVLCELSGNATPRRVVRIDNNIVEKVHAIVREQQAIKDDNTAMKRLRSKYKGSYTYYYLFYNYDDSCYKGTFDKDPNVKKQ